MRKEKPTHPKKTKSGPDFIKFLMGEDQMHDDHGPVIIGGRDRKPEIPEEEESYEK
jgi:hypothetical protein